jgi:FtsP/CotA-like multicopper oxidase with cupredoxin domain
LRGIGPGGIPVAAPDAFPAPVTGVTRYSLTIGQFTDQLHPGLGPTTLWGYHPAVALGGGVQPRMHLGGIIVAQLRVPIQLTFTNTLPSKHILPVNTSANFTDAKLRQNATTTHLHGGLTPWISDGGPFTWFTPDGQYGPSAQSAAGNIYKLLNPGLQPGQAEYHYPNNQSARLVWYHDHAHNITRLNAYAGIASAYIIRDTFEGNLRTLGLPDFVENGGRELPIVIQDKIFFVLGTEGGFLPKPVQVASNRPFDPTSLSGSLITGPAERWDLLVNFSKLAGQKLILYNDAPTPFPGGDPRNDYFPGAPGNPTQPQLGFGPNTSQILRFKVVPATSKDAPLRITGDTDLTPDLTPFLVPPGTAVQSGVPVRQLTLNETFDGYGRLIQLLGTNQSLDGGFGRAYEDPAAETPTAGSTKVWQIANLTEDTHPIHFHLVDVQALARQPFNADSYTGPARGPGMTELGWKETVRMNTGEVSTVIMKFDLPQVPFTVG